MTLCHLNFIWLIFKKWSEIYHYVSGCSCLTISIAASCPDLKAEWAVPSSSEQQWSPINHNWSSIGDFKTWQYSGFEPTWWEGYDPKLYSSFPHLVTAAPLNWIFAFGKALRRVSRASLTVSESDLFSIYLAASSVRKLHKICLFPEEKFTEWVNFPLL